MRKHVTVGHKSTQKATDHFLMDCDCLEDQLNQAYNHDDNNTDFEDTEDIMMAEEVAPDGEEDYGYGDPLEEGTDDDDKSSEIENETDVAPGTWNTEDNLNVVDPIESFSFNNL
jgi:hypothetical protein